MLRFPAPPSSWRQKGCRKSVLAVRCRQTQRGAPACRFCSQSFSRVCRPPRGSDRVVMIFTRRFPLVRRSETGRKSAGRAGCTLYTCTRERGVCAAILYTCLHTEEVSVRQSCIPTAYGHGVCAAVLYTYRTRTGCLCGSPVGAKAIRQRLPRSDV